MISPDPFLIYRKNSIPSIRVKTSFYININNWNMKLDDFNRELLTIFNDFRNDGPSCKSKPSSKAKINCGKIYAIEALPFITDYYERMGFLRLFSPYLYNTIMEKYLR